MLCSRRNLTSSEPNLRSYIIVRLFIIAAFVIAIGLFVWKLFYKKQDDNVIDGEVFDAEARPIKRSLFPVLLLGVVLAGSMFFVLPRFGISLTGLLQKAIAFLPFIRGFLPF